MAGTVGEAVGTWARVRGEMRDRIGDDACQNWIDPLAFVGADHGVAQIAAPTSFIGTWVARNYGEVIQQLLCNDGMEVSRLEFTVAAAGPCARADAPEPARSAPIAAVEAGHGGAADIELQHSPLEGRFTFDNFVVGKPNELAHAAALRVAEDGSVWVALAQGAIKFNPDALGR